MPALTLISHDLCPFVQRAVIALSEKSVPFERIVVDLANKPDWFEAVSPLGKVPLLRVGEVVIFESAVILEYLEETQPKPLHPADPVRHQRTQDHRDHRHQQRGTGNDQQLGQHPVRRSRRGSAPPGRWWAGRTRPRARP